MFFSYYSTPFKKMDPDSMNLDPKGYNNILSLI